MLECLFITIIHQQDLKKKGFDYIHWLNTARYTNVANTRKRWASCLIKNYTGSERLTYSQQMLIIFTPK